VFAKAGAHYSSMDVGGNPAFVQTGKESGWGPRYGIGAQIGLTPCGRFAAIGTAIT